MRTTITSEDQDLEVAVSFGTGSGCVNEIEVHWHNSAGPADEMDRVSFRLTGFPAV